MRNLAYREGAFRESPATATHTSVSIWGPRVVAGSVAGSPPTRPQRSSALQPLPPTGNRRRQAHPASRQRRPQLARKRTTWDEVQGEKGPLEAPPTLTSASALRAHKTLVAHA